MGFEKSKPISFVKCNCFPDSEEVTVSVQHPLVSLRWRDLQSQSLGYRWPSSPDPILLPLELLFCSSRVFLGHVAPLPALCLPSLQSCLSHSSSRPLRF